MDLTDLRKEIDSVDAQLVDLFCQRMSLSQQVADYKKENHLPIYVPSREKEKLKEIASQAGDNAPYARVLYSTIFELSRGCQSLRSEDSSPLFEDITRAIMETPPLFPQDPMVACQGVEGSYAQIACEKLFRSPDILYFKNFDGVFSAIEQGLCKYGVLPIENSTAGSVNQVYDLMARHNCSIVRTFRLKVDHELLANPGTAPEDIQEIYSHAQALSQCESFLKKFPKAKLIPVENTAAAARMVASSGRKDVACIASHACIRLYNLQSLASSIQDTGNNRTRFICISKNLEIYPGADRTSIMMILDHEPGALYKVLARLYTLGINVTKLESRPIPDREFEFLFYFDLETSIYSPEFVQLMCQLHSLCQHFQYLGSYSEVV